MDKFTRNISINRPVQEVFDFLRRSKLTLGKFTAFVLLATGLLAPENALADTVSEGNGPLHVGSAAL
jgi:hypothetical protein